MASGYFPFDLPQSQYADKDEVALKKIHDDLKAWIKASNDPYYGGIGSSADLTPEDAMSDGWYMGRIDLAEKLLGECFFEMPTKKDRLREKLREKLHKHLEAVIQYHEDDAEFCENVTKDIENILTQVKEIK